MTTGPFSGPSEHGDGHLRGAALERTRLSWRRTVLAATVVALLAGRLAVATTAPAIAAVCVAVTAAGWLALVALTQHRIHRLPGPVGRVLPAVVLVVIGYCVLAAALILL